MGPPAKRLLGVEPNRGFESRLPRLNKTAHMRSFVFKTIYFR